MPTQENLGEFASGNETTQEKPSATLAVKAQAKGKPNLTATANGMTKGEALAVAWTGIEALKQLGAAKVYRSKAAPNIMWIMLIDTEYTANGGLVEVK